MWKAFASNFIIHLVELLLGQLVMIADSWPFKALHNTHPPPPLLTPNWPNYRLLSKTAGDGGKENIYSLFQTKLVCRRPKGYGFCAVSVWKRV